MLLNEKNLNFIYIISWLLNLGVGMMELNLRIMMLVILNSFVMLLKCVLFVLV